jgi:hypothetical protein
MLMIKGKRGQASIESMFVLGILLMIFIVLSYTVYRNYVKSEDLKMYIVGTHLANSIADQMNDLNALGEGYSAIFILPAKLTGGGTYTVNFYQNESSVFVEGGGFSTGQELRYSSPLSTSRVGCTLIGCNNTCNKSTIGTCLNITDRTEVRIVKYQGMLYLTSLDNVLQGKIKDFIVPFQGDGEVDLENPGYLVSNADNPWNTILVYHNRINNTLSLVFSMNLTDNEGARMNVNDLVGDVVEVRSNGAGRYPEFNIKAIPAADFRGNDTGDVDGGSIIFAGGFQACITPVKNNMPTQDWLLLSSDGKRIILDKNEKVCVSYP